MCCTVSYRTAPFSCRNRNEAPNLRLFERFAIRTLCFETEPRFEALQLQFHRRLRDVSCLPDLLDRKFGPAIGGEEAVGLLVSIGELRVAKSGKQLKRTNCFKEPAIRDLKCGTVLAPGVTPGRRGFFGGEGDPTELGEHHGLPLVGMAAERH